jgi:penicillin amidase
MESAEKYCSAIDLYCLSAGSHLESIAMATTTVSINTARSSHRFWRIAALLLCIPLILILTILGWSYWIARSALPQLDGRVQVHGLSTTVTVTRDGHGVPTIEAANFKDLFFAQGYVTTQDRLWQMDVMRRFAAGDLSEVLGADLLRHDQEQRILGMRVAAQKIVEAMPSEDRVRFEAYADGVNAYIQSHRNRLPVEFRILGYAPRPWTPEDSELIAAHMIKDLTHYSYKSTLTREKILAKLGPELTADLYVNSSVHDRPPTVIPVVFQKNTHNDEENEDDQGSDNGDSVVQNFGPGEEVSEPSLLAGSNNWVVSGAHTVSGKPLLSNDMHLGHQMPNLWYEAHLKSGPLDVIGVTLPGMPYVIMGHNQRIAWGFTNLGATVEDVYIETFNSAGQYLTPDGWKNAMHRHEIIHVKGKPDEFVDVVLTRHGPIISSLVPGENRQIALRWTLYDRPRNPLFAVDSAQNWEQFRQAFSSFEAPGQNVVFADVDGNIGYQAAGKVPIRASGDGRLPEDGSKNIHEWTGYIPFEKLPRVYNPASGIIATANSRVTPDRYPYSVSTGWEAPWRTERIYRVLESGKKFSAADMLALQNDIYSYFDHFAAERFSYSVDHAKAPSARAQQAAEIMRGWDGRMSADSAAPTLAYRSRAELTKLLLQNKLGDAKEIDYHWGMQSVWLENVMRDQPRRWLPHKFLNYDELLTAAVEAAVSEPGASQDLASWKWGEVNPVEIQHPLFARIPLLKRWRGPGLQTQSGSGYAVKAVTRTRGPSERITVDLAELDASTLNLVTGQGGNFLSPYYIDQWEAWHEGTTFTLPFSKQAVAGSRVHTITLEPVGRFP